jgi:hypothetical protein
MQEAETVKLILFTKTITHPACRHLTKALELLAVPFRIITDRHALQDAMLQMRINETLFIFLFANTEEMELLNEIRPQILDRKIITILPDDTELSRSIGCSVLPRFQALLSDNLTIVAEVAARIIRIDSEVGRNSA